jgi:predicted secreted protein
MYFPSVTELFLAQPPIYLITGRGAPMQLTAEASPFRTLCDVHLKPAGADVWTARRARASQTETVDAALQSAELSAGEKLQKASGGGRP